MTLEFILLIISGYLLGSVPSAYLAAKWWRGIDIRRYGSGNVGGSNLFKLVPLYIGIPAFAFDILKGLVPVFIAGQLGMGFTRQVAVGAAAIAGHNWPVFLGFNGGRGIAATLGVVFVLMPRLTVVLLSIVLISIPFHQMALLTIIVIGLFPVFAHFSGLPAASWLFGRTLGAEEQLSATLALAGIFLMTAVRRLTAPRSEFADGLTPAALYANRLLFDRDIRDREKWVNRNINGDAGGRE